jgi:hypothetical protein
MCKAVQKKRKKAQTNEKDRVFELGVVMYTYNSSTWDAEVGRMERSRPHWTT